MPTTTRLVLAIAVLPALFACNGVGGVGVAPIGPVPIEDFAAVGSDVVCTQIADCCPSLFEERQEQIDRCRDTIGPVSASVVEDLQESIDAGRLTYDGSITGDCLRRIEARGCGAVPADDPYGVGCEEAFVPAVMEGGACSDDVECVTGRCDGILPDMDGSCVAQVAEGGDCSRGDCEDGLYCPSSSRTCVPRRDDGASCDSDRECRSDSCDEGSCVANRICS